MRHWKTLNAPSTWEILTAPYISTATPLRTTQPFEEGGLKGATWGRLRGKHCFTFQRKSSSRCPSQCQPYVSLSCSLPDGLLSSPVLCPILGVCHSSALESPGWRLWALGPHFVFLLVFLVPVTLAVQLVSGCAQVSTKGNAVWLSFMSSTNKVMALLSLEPELWRHGCFWKHLSLPLPRLPLKTFTELCLTCWVSKF